jgi:PKD repeat protein
MGEVLTVYQYQPVLFTNTTTGATPITLLWDFPGGTPLSSTGNTQSVIYNAPGQYTVTLTATDFYGTIGSLTEDNIIRVNPISITPGISGPTPSTVKMNEGYNLYDNSSGNPYPAISWYWQLPYGVTASTQNVVVAGYVDWYTLTGTYSGSPGSSYTGNISLTVNNGYSPGTAVTSVLVQKEGPSEIIYMNATGAFSSNYVSGLTGGLVTVYLNPLDPATAEDFGYAGDTNFVFRLNFSLRGSSNQFNQYFHSTSESAYSLIQTGFWNTNPSSDPPIGGYLIVKGSVYNPNYSPITANNAILYGEYAIQNQLYDFFIVDKTGFLEDKYTNYNYNISLLSYLIKNPYRIVHSGNIQFLNSNENPGSPAGISFVGPTGPGASGSNPMVYSRQYLNSLGSSSYLPYPIYQVYISAVVGGSPYGATASFSSVGLTGNDPITSGNFYVAQDNSNGIGFVKILNNAINSSILGGTGSLEFVSGSYFNCGYATGPTAASFNPNNYNGVALLIKNKVTVGPVTITDNSFALGNSYTPPIKLAPFMANTANLQASTETCTGMFADPIIQSVSFNSFSLGGSINYP